MIKEYILKVGDRYIQSLSNDKGELDVSYVKDDRHALILTATEIDNIPMLMHNDIRDLVFHETKSRIIKLEMW